MGLKPWGLQFENGYYGSISSLSVAGSFDNSINSLFCCLLSASIAVYVCILNNVSLFCSLELKRSCNRCSYGWKLLSEALLNGCSSRLFKLSWTAYSCEIGGCKRTPCCKENTSFMMQYPAASSFSKGRMHMSDRKHLLFVSVWTCYRFWERKLQFLGLWELPIWLMLVVA